MVTFNLPCGSLDFDTINNHLATRAYISGYTPTKADSRLFTEVSKSSKSRPTEKHHVQRWFNHLNSYTAEEQAAFPDCSGGVVPAVVPAVVEEEEDEDEDVDLFGSDDEEDDAAAKVREERLAAYAEKKSKKPGPIAKSQILLDVKPWDDETDMKALEGLVRAVAMDGLVWGASELKPLAYGINKLSILATVVDDKVSVDDLTEKIEANEDHVQSVDIAAFNKV